MKKYFPQQTGDVLISMYISSASESGIANINFGCKGLAYPNFSFIMDNSSFKDKDGIFFGSYQKNKINKIDISLKDNLYSYYYNNLLLKTHLKSLNQDLDYIELNNSGNLINQYSLNYNISGSLVDTYKNILYITDDYNLESGIIDAISGLSIFNGDIGFRLSNNLYTGILTESQIDVINNNYNLIIFGQKIISGKYFDKTGWSSIKSPIIFLNAKTAAQNEIGIISGIFCQSSGSEKTWAKRQENLTYKNNFANSLLRRNDINYSGIGYLLYSLDSGKYISYSKLFDSESILINDSGNNLTSLDETSIIVEKSECDSSSSSSNSSVSSLNNSLILVDVLNKGEQAWQNGVYQNGKRVIFNTPITSDYSLYSITTDEWKKILLSSIYELTQIDTKIKFSSTSSSSSSSNSSELFWKEKLNDANRQWYDTAISENGEYQSAVVLDGKIWKSSDYGNNWTQVSTSHTGFISIAMSKNGQYQTALGNNSRIWRSTNYGSTFSEISSMSTKSWRKVSISGNGQYQTAVVSSGKIWRSDDYGATWSEVTSSQTSFWISVVVSEYGNIQSAVSSGASFGKIWRSIDYGQTWENVDATTRNYNDISMNPSGMYQTAVVSNGYVYISSNFGKTWKEVSSYAAWRSVSISKDGRIQVLVGYNTYINISYDYGNTWQSTDGVKLWQSISMNYNASYILAAIFTSSLYITGLIHSSSSSSSSNSSSNSSSISSSVSSISSISSSSISSSSSNSSSLSSISSSSISSSSSNSSNSSSSDQIITNQCIYFNGTGGLYASNYEGNYYFTGFTNGYPYWIKTGLSDRYIYWENTFPTWGIGDSTGLYLYLVSGAPPEEPVDSYWLGGGELILPTTTGCI